MVLPFTVGLAAVTQGFVDSGLESIRNKERSDANIAEKNLESANRIKEIEAQYKAMDANNSRKAAYENAAFNRSILGIQYNVANIPEKEQSGYALNKLIANADQAKTFLRETKKNNPSAYRNAIGEFNRIFSLEYNKMAKVAGTIEGGVAAPDLRDFGGLSVFKDIPEVNKVLTTTSGYFNDILNAKDKTQDDARRIQILSGSTDEAEQAAVPLKLKNAFSDTPTNQLTPKIVSAAKERVTFDGSQVLMEKFDNKPVYTFYNKTALNASDEAALGTHYMGKINAVATDTGDTDAYNKRISAAGALYDAHKAQTRNPEMIMQRPARRNIGGPERQRMDAWNAKSKTALVRNFLKSKQTVLKTATQVNKILRDIYDLLQKPGTAVGLGANLLRLGDGLIAQADQFKQWFRGGLGDDAAIDYFTDRKESSLVFAELEKNLKIYEDEKLKLKDGKFSVSNTVLLQSLSHIAAFYLARISQEDDSKISNHDVEQHKEALGLNKWLTSKETAKERTKYFISQSTDKIMKLQGY